MDIESILSRIPEYKNFMTMEEIDCSTHMLAKEYPDVVTVFEAGKSQSGRSVYCLKIGNGSNNALIIGCPHPNEPIGAMMLEAFSKILASDKELREELDYTFYIIKAVDPDGLVRNEGWFKDPFTYYNYVRHFYRPAGFKQVEWTFPLDYKTLHFHDVLPETKAVMKIIEEKSPKFLFSLHNGVFNGAYWYINKNNEDLIKHLHAAAERQNLPLNLGEPEIPCCKIYGDAVFEFPGMPLIYDYYEKAAPGYDPAQMLKYGDCSIDFANLNGRNCAGLVCEMPYFETNASNDLTLMDISRKEAVLQSSSKIEAIYNEMKPLLEVLYKYVPENNPYRLALQERMNIAIPSIEAQINYVNSHSEEYDVPATKAQWIDNLVVMPFMHELAVGMIAAAAEQSMEYADKIGKKELSDVVKHSEKIIKDFCSSIEKEVPCKPISIKKLVSVQLESGIYAAIAAKNK